MSDTKTISASQIGRSLARVEARAKVTGRAEYIHNLRLPRMLWAKIARSTVPHGRIRHIDTSAAQATHGVYSVVTGEDILRVIPDPYFGPAFHDQPILALGKVPFAGEPVAVVPAEDPKIAEAAAQEISIASNRRTCRPASVPHGRKSSRSRPRPHREPQEVPRNRQQRQQPSHGVAAHAGK